MNIFNVILITYSSYIIIGCIATVYLYKKYGYSRRMLRDRYLEHSFIHDVFLWPWRLIKYTNHMKVSNHWTVDNIDDILNDDILTLKSKLSLAEDAYHKKYSVSRATALIELKCQVKLQDMSDEFDQFLSQDPENDIHPVLSKDLN